MTSEAEEEISRRAFVAGASAAALVGGTAHGMFLEERGESSDFEALLTRIYREQLVEAPQNLTSLGLDVGADAWARSALDSQKASHRAQMLQLRRGWRAELQAIDRRKLTGTDVTSYDCVAYDLERSIGMAERFPFGREGFPQPYVLSQLGGTYLSVPEFLANQHPVADRADAAAYVERLRAFAGGLDEETLRARTDAAGGVVPPGAIIDRALSQMRALRAGTADQSGLVGSLVIRATKNGIPGDWLKRASTIVADEVWPALDGQVALLESWRHQGGQAGVGRLRDGEAYYGAALRFQTTTGTAPDDIHRLGLQLVGELSAEIDGHLRHLGMAHGSVGQRYAALFKDRRFIYPNTDVGKAALVDFLNGRVKSVTAKLPSYFGSLPHAGLEIRRVPAEREAGATSGEYQDGSIDGRRPGIYYINLRNTAEVPRWTLPTLTFHEGIPGHHLQGALALETPDLPMIRRTLWFTAYGEGWALYAEQIADEMGLYSDDPWGRLGYLHDALMRAARLVLDTGLHHRRWTRGQAIRYFMDVLGNAEAYATTEVERYCVWPGQACSYMIGKTTLLRLRDQAKAAIGSRFDIRRFHDAVLLQGTMPLEVLERHLTEWSQRERRLSVADR